MPDRNPTIVICNVYQDYRKVSNPYVLESPGSVIHLYGSGSFHQQANKWRKTMISTVLRHLYDFLSLKNDCKCIFKMNKHKIGEKIIFCWRREGHWHKELDLEPDQLVKGTDPRIRICTKRSRIRNTDFNNCGLPIFVLVVNGLLAVAKDLAAWFARIGSLFPAKR